MFSNITEERLPSSSGSRRVSLTRPELFPGSERLWQQTVQPSPGYLLLQLLLDQFIPDFRAIDLLSWLRAQFRAHNSYMIYSSRDCKKRALSSLRSQ